MNLGTTDQPEQTGPYEIRLQGSLDPRWSAWLGGLDITPGTDGITVLHAAVVDQSALHGLLARLRDIGLPLISVVRIKPDQRTGAIQGTSRTDTDNSTGD